MCIYASIYTYIIFNNNTCNNNRKKSWSTFTLNCLIYNCCNIWLILLLIYYCPYCYIVYSVYFVRPQRPIITSPPVRRNVSRSCPVSSATLTLHRWTAALHSPVLSGQVWPAHPCTYRWSASRTCSRRHQNRELSAKQAMYCKEMIWGEDDWTEEGRGISESFNTRANNIFPRTGRVGESDNVKSGNGISVFSVELNRGADGAKRQTTIRLKKHRDEWRETINLTSTAADRPMTYEGHGIHKHPDEKTAGSLAPSQRPQMRVRPSLPQ